MGLPHTRRQHDSIWVIVDRMTKSAHFNPVKVSHSMEDYAKLYIREIVKLHGVPLSIISDRGTQFTSHFWKAFQKGLGTNVKLSTTFHPQMDGQAEWTIQTLEDMLRASVIDFKGNWDDHLPLIELKQSILDESVEAFSQGGDGVRRYQGRLCVPVVDALRERILEEAHGSQYSIHPGATKMYRDLREIYWWNGMKGDIASFVAKCPNCQQVKIEHQRPGGLYQDISIPTWKWEDVNMDFVVGLPRTRRQHDSIWVIIDRMTKSSHFLPVKTAFLAEDYAMLYIKVVVSLHAYPLSII